MDSFVYSTSGELSKKYNYTQLKHTTTLFFLSDHYILSRWWRVIIDQVQTKNIIIMVGLWYYNQSGATKLLIMNVD